MVRHEMQHQMPARVLALCHWFGRPVLGSHTCLWCLICLSIWQARPTVHQLLSLQHTVALACLDGADQLAGTSSADHASADMLQRQAHLCALLLACLGDGGQYGLEAQAESAGVGRGICADACCSCGLWLADSL